jgi:small subunit ribosomal protein S14
VLKLIPVPLGKLMRNPSHIIDSKDVHSLMAKTCQIARNAKRAALHKKFDERRIEYKKIMKSPSSSPDEVVEAFLKLQKLPRNSSPVRFRNRCLLTGRSRGNLTKFGLCRNEFRRLAHLGQIVGVTKSSW